MEFSERELFVIGHALKHLYDEVTELQSVDDNAEDFNYPTYLSEINNIQTRITDNMPRETLN